MPKLPFCDISLNVSRFAVGDGLPDALTGLY